MLYAMPSLHSKLNSPATLIHAVLVPALFVLCAISSTAHGTDSDSLLASYVAESWESHPNVERIRAMIAAENSRTTMSNSWMNPELRAGLMNIPESFNAHADPMTMFQIGAMQQIPFPGKLNAARRAGEARVSAATATLDQEKFRMAAMVAMAYYDLAAALETRQTLEQGLLLTKQAVDAATSLLTTGKGSQTEVLRAGLEKEEWSLKLIANASEIEKKRAALAYAVGRTDASTLVDPVLPNSLPPLIDLDAALATTVVASTPQIRIAQAQSQASEFELRRTRLEYWPDIKLGLAYGIRGALNGTGTDPHTGELISQSSKQDNMATIELSAPVPLFYRGNQRAKIQEARAMNRDRQGEKSESVLNLQQELRIVHAEFMESKNQFEVNSRVMQQAEAAWHSALVDYQAGMYPYMGLSEARMILVMAQTESVMYRAKAWAIYQQWQSLLGKFSVETSEQ
jgi:outer membrane protein TolC